MKQFPIKVIKKWRFKDKKYMDGRRRKDFVDFNDITAFFGIRGNGKSYTWTNIVVREAVESWLKYHDEDKVIQFVWARQSWEVLRDGLDSWGEPVKLQDGYFIKAFRSGVFLYQTVEIETKKGVIEKDRLICKIGSWAFISSPDKAKSKSYNNVKYLVLDEYVSEFGRYWVNEPEKFSSIISSVGRDRPDFKVVMLGNSISPENPYHNYWGIGVDDLPPSGEAYSYLLSGIDDDGSYYERIVGIERVEHSQWLRDKKKTSTASRITSGTGYGNYSDNGEWLIDNSQMVVTHPDERMEFKYNVKLYGTRFKIHQYGKFGYYIERGNEPLKNMIFLTLNDADIEGKGTQFYNPDWLVSLIRNRGNFDRLFFDSVDTKEMFLKWLSFFK